MEPGIEIENNVPLAPLTTLQIGGTARYFVRAATESQVAEAVRFASENGLNLFVLGGGSNVLFADGELNALVLKVSLKGVVVEPDLITDSESIVYLTAAAGEDWDRFVAFCVENNLAGVECLSGIPGLIGGTPVQNVGAYGQEVADTIVDVRCFDRINGQFVNLANFECEFSYRTSIFNSNRRDRYIVLGVKFALNKNGTPLLAYRELEEYFAHQSPSLSDVRDAVIKIRKLKSMVIDPNDPNSKSAGSFFKNPIVGRDKLEHIKTAFENVPHFDFGAKVKIPAAWLIEKAGFSKGFVLNNAGISSNHTLAIINRGGASADEILLLKREIQAAVAEKFAIELVPEPVFVGF